MSVPLLAPFEATADATNSRKRVVALSGGVGGAKLAVGLAQSIPTGALTVIANTGDDFEHLGLCISPDLDTLMYSLAGLDDPKRGWGRRDETWTFMMALSTLGGDTWFQLGDGDLATSIERTRRLRSSQSLTEVTDGFRRHLGIASRLLPMSDDPVRTRVRTQEGWLPFQEYFVRQACRPQVLEVAFEGVESARPQPGFMAALSEPNLAAVIICPSNPLLSIDPILSISGVREAIASCHAPVVAVSPIINGNAVKGPTAKMMTELGMEVSAASIARRYAGLIDAYLIDDTDADKADECEVPTRVTSIWMRTLEEKKALAQVAITVAEDVRADRRRNPGRAENS
jgi:LPPG:FO 2-phospho-L-lactate transferase